MSRTSQKLASVVFPDISPTSSQISLSQSSAGSTVQSTPIYNNAFLKNLQTLHHQYTHASPEILVPDSRPPTPDSEHRVRRLQVAMQKSLDESPHVVPGMITLLCVRYPVSRSTIHPSRLSSSVTTPGEGERTEGLGLGDDVESSLPTLTREDAKKFQRQRLGQIPVDLDAYKHDPEVSSPAKKRKLLHNHDEAKPAPNLPFRAVKRLKAAHQKEDLEDTSNRSLGRSTVDVNDARDIPLSPTQPAASQELSLHVEPAALRPHSSLDMTFDLDRSMVSLSLQKEVTKCLLNPSSCPPQTFDPFNTSTPTKTTLPNAFEPTPSGLKKTTPNISPTPRRTRAAEYREKVATPIADVATIRLDPRAVQRVPTLTDLMKSSAKSRRERQDTTKRKLASLDGSQGSQTQSQAQSSQEEHVAPIVAPAFGSSPREPSTPSQNRAPPAATSTPIPTNIMPTDRRTNMLSPVTSFFGEQNLTASARKRKTFGSVLSLGSLGFSSQFDVESKVDDISRFMKDDVDDVFL